MEEKKYAIMLHNEFESLGEGNFHDGSRNYSLQSLTSILFGQGTHYDIYRKLGAHPVKQGKKEGVYFAVWAPNAQAVSVIGEFNDWNEQAAPMKKAGPIGVFETFVPGAKIGTAV